MPCPLRAARKIFGRKFLPRAFWAGFALSDFQGNDRTARLTRSQQGMQQLQMMPFIFMALS
jgi:hypothetical protein